MAIFCFFGRTRKFVRKGDPKRYLYFWGIWSPFTVRIFYGIMRHCSLFSARNDIVRCT